jgi:hypothetical protein
MEFNSAFEGLKIQPTIKLLQLQEYFVGKTDD